MRFGRAEVHLWVRQFSRSFAEGAKFQIGYVTEALAEFFGLSGLSSIKAGLPYNEAQEQAESRIEERKEFHG